MIAFVSDLFFPKDCLGLEIIHDEFRRRKGRITVSRSGEYHHNLIHGTQRTNSMNHRGRDQRPACLGFGHDGLDTGFRHTRVMFQRKGRDFAAIACVSIIVSDQAYKTGNGPDLLATRRPNLAIMFSKIKIF